NTIFAEGSQILLQEPTMVAIIIDEDKMVEWGQAAKNMEGRVPDSIEVVRPLRHGVIAEYEVTETLLKYLTKKVCGPMRLFRPRMMITVPGPSKYGLIFGLAAMISSREMPFLAATSNRVSLP
ncbi:MAG: hypothetical protein CVU45_09450, partial [Chloroflexi bacterium HGW-Chloroflexi-7]